MRLKRRSVQVFLFLAPCFAPLPIPLAIVHARRRPCMSAHPEAAQPELQRLTLRARIGIEKRRGLPTGPNDVPRATPSRHAPSGVGARELGSSVAVRTLPEAATSKLTEICGWPV